MEGEGSREEFGGGQWKALELCCAVTPVTGRHGESDPPAPPPSQSLRSQAVRQEGWIFYTVTTVLPFPGEMRDKHGPAERGEQESCAWQGGRELACVVGGGGSLALKQTES